MTNTSTTYKKTLNLGKVDARGTDRKNNLVEVAIELDRNRLSICGNVWNSRHTDINSGGQNYEEIAELFPRSRKVQRIVEVWKRWHLNDMNAGDAVQEAWLRENGHGKDYAETCEKLREAGLLVHDDYQYGTAWKTEELPQEIVDEVKSW